MSDLGNNIEHQAVLMTNSWAGYLEQPIIIIGETAKKYKIKAKNVPVKLPGFIYLRGNDSILVPKYAVKFI